jgi:colanic acid/amylovoran biosynthesis glycosyltransferase
MRDIEVLHCFQFYLPHTMNWAYRIIAEHPRMAVRVAAPLIIQNQYYTPDFRYLWSPFQVQRPRREWDILRPQALLSSLTKHLYWHWAYQKLTRKKPQLIHAHFAPTGCQVMGLARRLGCPLVVSFYGFDYEKLPNTQPRYRQRYQRLFQEAAHFLCEGPHGAAQLQRMGCPPEKVSILRLGRVLDGLPAPVAHPKRPNSLRILQAATFTEKKGHLYALQAFHNALPNCPEATLTLVGEALDKGLYAEVLRYIREHGLEANVQVLEFVENQDFAHFLSGFDLLLQPSTYAADGDCEGGAPVVLLDAQLAGLPVLSTRHCDIPDLVVDGQTGILCAERDVDALAAGIQRFYTMQSIEYERFSMAAQLHVRTGFDVRDSRKQLADLYERITCTDTSDKRATQETFK